MKTYLYHLVDRAQEIRRVKAQSLDEAIKVMGFSRAEYWCPSHSEKFAGFAILNNGFACWWEEITG